MESAKRSLRKKKTELVETPKTPMQRDTPKKNPVVTSVKKERPVRNVEKGTKWKEYQMELESNTSEDSENETYLTDQSHNEEQNVSSFRKLLVKNEELFESQENMEGQSKFLFQSNKKRHGMTGVATEANSGINNSQVLNTPKSKLLKPTTPYTLRKKLKSQFSKLLDEEDDEVFSESDDEEFILNVASSDSEEEDEQISNSKNEGDSDSDTDYAASSTSTKLSTSKRNIAPSQFRGKDNQYVMKSDDYFSWQASSKIATSNHTLQKLKNPKLTEDELQRLLMSCSLNQSKEHEKAIHEMVKLNCCNFNKWLYILHEGFNVLLYGFGSKRNILITFQNEMVANSAVIVVHGYFPSLTIKDVTDSILLDVLKYKTAPGNVFDALEVIKEKCKKLKNEHFYLIVHNIDGPMLRNHKSQTVLSSLADISNIHLLASVDHINTPLIWDHTKLSKFNFTWWDATSFLPYTDETSFENSMLIQRSGALALSSLSNVYQSLTKNSKGIFMLIVKYQLNNKSVKYYQGMPFKVLYSQCRENFFVSSDLVLRTQLIEFLDHKLVKSKRAADGIEHLLIPLNHSLLQPFLEQTSR